MPPYLDDDFQGYAIGTNLPFGSWIADPGAFTGQIQAEPGGTGIPGTDRSFFLFGDAAYVRGYLSTFTEYVALREPSGAIVPIAFANGPNAFSQTFTLLQLRIEPDSTITASCPTSGEFLANSGDFLLRPRVWNFLQLNVAFSDVAGKVHIDFELALNGQSIMAFGITTTASVAVLAGGTSEVNRFQFRGGNYGAFTLDTPQPISTYPHAGSPVAALFQAPIEVGTLPDTAKVVIAQALLEVDTLPDDAELVVAQALIEIDTLIRQRGRAEYIHRRHYPGN